MITTTDPRTGVSHDTSLSPTSTDDVHAIVAAATAAFADLGKRSAEWRAGLLRALAQGLEKQRVFAIAAAAAETGLPEARLGTELTRCVLQFELFADAVEEGGFLEVTIDHAATTALGPQPEIRRMLVALGPVAVFGSSNFPFAFSVPGGDTASALAAGCPVVLKAHGSHPLTSQICFDALAAAAAEYGAPEGIIGIVYGQRAGIDLVTSPGIAAVGFTGALSTGKILLEAIGTRPDPIPFYGELSSVNPLVVLPGALVDPERIASIAQGLGDSVLGSAGQLCTKPGAAFIPEGQAGDRLVDALRVRFDGAEALAALNARVKESYDSSRERLGERPGVEVLSQAEPVTVGSHAQPALLSVAAVDLTADEIEEAFGPLVVVVRYGDDAQLRDGLAAVPPSLTASIHSAESDADRVRDLVAFLLPRAGRLVFDGYPTGVRVSWGQHHGGPWPSTNTTHTSVGVSAVRRFLRPVAWQNAPGWVLPRELRDGFTAIPRRIDGVLLPGDASVAR